MIMTNSELLKVKGGAFSAALLAAVYKMVTGIFNLGQTLGSALSYAIKGRKC